MSTSVPVTDTRSPTWLPSFSRLPLSTMVMVLVCFPRNPLFQLRDFGASVPLVSFSRMLGHGLAHPTPRKEDEEIDRQIADHQQGHGEPGYDTGSERHDAHDLGERGFIDLIGDVR